MSINASNKDRYGLVISTSSADAAAHYQEGLDLALSQNFGAEEAFARAVEVDEGFALAHADLAFMQFQALALPEAKASAEKARELMPGVTLRERRHIDVISLFINGENHKATAAVNQHFQEFPLDALLLRLAQRLYIQGCTGAGVPDYPPLFYMLMKDVESHYGEDWAFTGQFAWANHEIGRMAEGLRLAERSLDLNPANAVAVHSVAHVFFETNRNDEGAGFLGSWLDGFDRRASYRVHLSWHQALFQLAMGRYNQALGWYETEIRPAVVAKRYASLADSASLIWRMHIYGDTAPKAPWEELTALAAPAAAKPGPAFRDAHAALAFTAAGDEASFDKLVDGLQAMANNGDATASEATLPLVKGIGAFGQGDYTEAVRFLEPVFPQLTRVGGSHAQRQVFEDTVLEAFLRAEEFDKAGDMLRARLSQRESPRDSYWLGRAELGAGRTEEAAKSLEKARDGWCEADPGAIEIQNLSRMAEAAG